MRSLVLSLCLLFTAHSAAAEFTAAEKAEVVKLVVQQSSIATPFNQIGDGIRDYGVESLRPIFAATLVAAVDAAWECHEAFRGIFQVDGSTVQDGFVHVGGCQSKGLDYADAMDNLASVVSAANPDAAQWANSIHALASKIRAGKVGTFDTSLAFANPRPLSFPTVVGPHGDFESSEHHLNEMGEMFIRAIALGTSFYREVEVWPQGANGDFREFIRYAVTPVKNTARMWALQHGVFALTGDRKDVDDDIAAASAIGVQRGEDFFVALHNDELFNGSPHQPPLHSGRVQSGGSTENFAIGFAEFPKAWRDVIRVNTKEEIQTWFEGSVKSLSSSAPDLARISSNILPQWSEALSSAWKAGDAWNNSIFEFFHTVSFVCGPGTHAEGGACVADGGGGSTLVCGPGTHEDNGQCLPDPVVCPSFHAELQLLGPDSAQAVCIQN